jgi:DUF1016 N-terminal domain
LVVRNWLIGAHLLEFEQSGQDRATYGEQLLSNLAADLKIRGLKGLRISMLKNCRQFYRVYPDIRPSLAAPGYPSRSLRLSHRHNVLSVGLRKDLPSSARPSSDRRQHVGFVLYEAKTKR